MKPLVFSLLILALGGCARPSQPVPSHWAAPVTTPGTHSLDEFRFDWPRTTVQDVEAKVGKPDRDVGSGIYILEYRLRDGSSVLVGSSDNSRILYVDHWFSSNKRERIYARP